MNANNRQVGGNHYQADYQHWDFVEEAGLGYLEAQITRYVSRHDKKDGMKDVLKAIHYTEKLIELVQMQGRRPTRNTRAESAVNRFISSNSIPMQEALVLRACVGWYSVYDLGNILAQLRSVESAYYHGSIYAPTATADMVRTDEVMSRARQLGSIETSEADAAPGPGYVNQDR